MLYRPMKVYLKLSPSTDRVSQDSSKVLSARTDMGGGVIYKYYADTNLNSKSNIVE